MLPSSSPTTAAATLSHGSPAVTDDMSIYMSHAVSSTLRSVQLAVQEIKGRCVVIEMQPFTFVALHAVMLLQCRPLAIVCSTDSHNEYRSSTIHMNTFQSDGSSISHRGQSLRCR
jgi:hypothetical protein